MQPLEGPFKEPFNEANLKTSKKKLSSQTGDLQQDMLSNLKNSENDAISPPKSVPPHHGSNKHLDGETANELANAVKDSGKKLNQDELDFQLIKAVVTYMSEDEAGLKDVEEALANGAEVRPDYKLKFDDGSTHTLIECARINNRANLMYLLVMHGAIPTKEDYVYAVQIKDRNLEDIIEKRGLVTYYKYIRQVALRSINEEAKNTDPQVIEKEFIIEQMKQISEDLSGTLELNENISANEKEKILKSIANAPNATKALDLLDRGEIVSIAAVNPNQKYSSIVSFVFFKTPDGNYYLISNNSDGLDMSAYKIDRPENIDRVIKKIRENESETNITKAKDHLDEFRKDLGLSDAPNIQLRMVRHDPNGNINLNTLELLVRAATFASSIQAGKTPLESYTLSAEVSKYYQIGSRAYALDMFSKFLDSSPIDPKLYSETVENFPSALGIVALVASSAKIPDDLMLIKKLSNVKYLRSENVGMLSFLNLNENFLSGKRDSLAQLVSVLKFLQKHPEFLQNLEEKAWFEKRITDMIQEDSNWKNMPAYGDLNAFSNEVLKPLTSLKLTNDLDLRNAVSARLANTVLRNIVEESWIENNETFAENLQTFKNAHFSNILTQPANKNILLARLMNLIQNPEFWGDKSSNLRKLKNLLRNLNASGLLVTDKEKELRNALTERAASIVKDNENWQQASAKDKADTEKFYQDVSDLRIIFGLNNQLPKGKPFIVFLREQSERT